MGIDSMPPGRFVSGVAQTSVGAVIVIGVCIPWFGSRTEARRGKGTNRPLYRRSSRPFFASPQPWSSIGTCWPFRLLT